MENKQVGKRMKVIEREKFYSKRKCKGRSKSSLKNSIKQEKLPSFDELMRKALEYDPTREDPDAGKN